MKNLQSSILAILFGIDRLRWWKQRIIELERDHHDNGDRHDDDCNHHHNHDRPTQLDLQ